MQVLEDCDALREACSRGSNSEGRSLDVVAEIVVHNATGAGLLW